MRMIPSYPHSTGSQAEKRVFDRLRLAFPGDCSFTAYHSLNLPCHEYKRFSEIDFVITAPFGLMLLEVKGGGVRCEEGVWYYTNRYGKCTNSVEGPFKQAQSALHSLRRKLSTFLPEHIHPRLTMGYGVVFPDCDWKSRSVEWDSETLLDARRFNDFEAWLQNLFGYWNTKSRKISRLDEDALWALNQALRPEFEAVIPLHVDVARTEEQIARLTEDQMTAVDTIHANKRVMISGGAGTGKTLLAMETARRWAGEGLAILLACRSSWLLKFLESRFLVPGLVACQPEAAAISARRAGVDAFDALIIDEGQDMLNMESLEPLNRNLKGGFNEGRWCFFYDINNQSGFFGEPEPKALHVLEHANPARIPLTTNCRNSRLILEEVQTRLKADMGVKGAGNGPKIREQRVSSTDESAQILEAEIHKLTEKGGLSLGQIVIISPFPFEQSSASRLPVHVQQNIKVLDEFSMRSFPPKTISFAQIHGFKGLESEAVIVIDLPVPGSDTTLHHYHYVAMSRARALLSMIFKE